MQVKIINGHGWYYDQVGRVFNVEDCDKSHYKESDNKFIFKSDCEIIGNTATKNQIGGNHYKDYAIQPIEFILKNNIGFCEGNIIKYACRWKNKNGLQDLLKIKHYVDLIIELEGLNEE